MSNLEQALARAVARERARVRDLAGGEQPGYRIGPPWIEEPASGQPFNYTNQSQVLLPAIGSEAKVVTFTVPPGRHGVIQAIGNQFSGGGWNEGSGDLVWRLDVDGVAANGFGNILSSIGSMANPGDFRASPIRIRENQLVELIARNVAIVLAAQSLLGLLRGYFYEQLLEGEPTWQ